ncbi:MAG: hypothetical protein OXN89_10835 [Bryobacterales bacterium]|nr:hypothetical protein [Bryobacterales bacterium]
MQRGDGGGLSEGGCGEGIVGVAVDQARQPARGLEERLAGGLPEQVQVAAGAAQAVGEVGPDLVAQQGGVVVADDDALAQLPWRSSRG